MDAENRFRVKYLDNYYSWFREEHKKGNWKDDLLFTIHKDDVEILLYGFNVGMRWFSDAVGRNNPYRYTKEVKDKYNEITLGGHHVV